MTEDERDLLIGIADAIQFLARQQEDSMSASIWKSEVHPSDQLARLIDAACEGIEITSDPTPMPNN